MPAAASATQSRSSGRRDPNTATPSGPTNSNVTAMPSGMRSSDGVEGEVHPGEREPEQQRRATRSRRLCPRSARPPDQRQHDRREQHAQEDGAAGADLVEERLRERRAELHRRTAPRPARAGRDAIRGDTRPDMAGHATRADNPPVAATTSFGARPERSYEELESIFAGVDAPFALVDLDAMWSNAREMLARARARRSAWRASRCAAAPLLRRDARARPGFRGLMTFTLPESLWLHGHGFDDLLLAYPTADRGGAGRAGAARDGAPADPDGGLGRAPRLHRGGRGRGRPADPGLHRARHGLVAARRAGEGGREALARAHPGAGAGARARDRRAGRASSWRR